MKCCIVHHFSFEVILIYIMFRYTEAYLIILMVLLAQK
jgi:hypothetical protein